MPKGIITQNDLHIGLTEYLKSRVGKETTIPDAYMAGAWDVAKVINSMREEVALIPVIGEVS